MGYRATKYLGDSLRSIPCRSKSIEILSILLFISTFSITNSERTMCNTKARLIFTLPFNSSQEDLNRVSERLAANGFYQIKKLTSLLMITACTNTTTKTAERRGIETTEFDLPSIRQQYKYGKASSEHENQSHANRTRKIFVSKEADSSIRTSEISWALDRLDQPSLPLDGRRYDPRKCSRRQGAGVHVFVIDTGCSVGHSAFSGRQVESMTAPNSRFENKKEAEDDNGHGTAVASLVIGVGIGVASRVKVTCIKALGNEGHGAFSDVAAGLDYVAGLKDTKGEMVRFVVLALAGKVRKGRGAIDEAASRAAKLGLVSFAAAGNDGHDACEYAPGRGESVVAVAATDEDDHLAKFSNEGRCVNAAMPGIKIDVADYRGGYRQASGTSYATPLAAGVVALLWQKVEKRRNELNVDKAKRIVSEFGGGLTDASGYSMPRLNGECHGGILLTKKLEVIVGGVFVVIVGLVLIIRIVMHNSHSDQ